MTNPRVSDLTLGDPDEGLVLRDDFSEALRRSRREVRDGGATRSLSDVADSLTSTE